MELYDAIPTMAWGSYVPIGDGYVTVGKQSHQMGGGCLSCGQMGSGRGQKIAEHIAKAVSTAPAATEMDMQTEHHVGPAPLQIKRKRKKSPPPGHALLMYAKKKHCGGGASAKRSRKRGRGLNLAGMRGYGVNLAGQGMAGSDPTYGGARLANLQEYPGNMGDAMARSSYRRAQKGRGRLGAFFLTSCHPRYY